MARPKVEDLQRTELLRPQAAPVNSYVRPAEPSRSPLHELAGSLEELGGALAGTLAARKANDDKEAELRAQRDHDLGTYDAQAEGQRAGWLPAPMSKPYNDAYKRAQGQSAGLAVPGNAEVAYNQWDKKFDQDPNSFTKFWEGFSRQQVERIPKGPDGLPDPRVYAAMKPHLDSTREAINNRHIKDLHDYTVTQGRDASIGSVISGVDQDLTLGGGVHGTTDFDKSFRTIEAKRQAYIQSGAAPDDVLKYDASLAHSLATRAIASDDPEEGKKLLEFFERTKPGTDVKWKDTPEVIKVVDAAKKTIESTSASKLRAQQEAIDRRKKEQLNDLERQTVDILYKDPDAPIPEDIRKAAEAIDADFTRKMTTTAQHFRDIRDKPQASSPRDMMDLTKQIMENPGDASRIITNATQLGIVRNMEDITKLQKLGENWKEHREEYAKVLENPAVKSISKTIEQRTPRPNKDVVFDPVVGSGMSDEGIAAQQSFNNYMMEWARTHPNASPSDVAAAAQGIGKTILDSITENPDGADKVLPAVKPGELANPDKAPPSVFNPTPELKQQFDAQGVPLKAAPRFTDGQKPLKYDKEGNLSLQGAIEPRAVPKDNTATEQGATPSAVPKDKPQVIPPNAPFTTKEESRSYEDFKNALGPKGRAKLEERAAAQGYKDVETYSRSLFRLNQQRVIDARKQPPPVPTAPPAPAAADPKHSMIDAAPEGITLKDGIQLASLTQEEIQQAIPEDLRPYIGTAMHMLGAAPPANAPEVGGMATAYSPQRNGSAMEGGYASSAKGPDGQAVVRTVRDYMDGTSKYVTVAGSKEFEGKRYILKSLTVNIDGQNQTLTNVPVVVHDTGGAFKGAPEGRFDIPVDKDMPSSQLNSQPFSKQQLQFVRDYSGGGAQGIQPNGTYKTYQGDAVSYIAQRSDKPRDKIEGLDKEFAARLAGLIDAAPPGIKEGLGVFSAYRSPEQQAALFAASDKSGRMVARPGHSFHEKGQAVDLSFNGKSLKHAPPEVIKWVHDNAGAYGIYFPMSWEKWHAEPIETTGQRRGKHPLLGAAGVTV